MKKQLLFVASLFCASLASAQDVYTNWTYHKNVILNTEASGAGVMSNVLNFPVLVSLAAKDSTIFKQASGTGADVRFSKSNLSIHLPYQIEHWDSAGRNALIWVLVDTVKGNINNQSIRMHWGKAGAVDSSRGAVVFNTANGFQAVWHMDGTAATSNEPDMTSNGFTATENGSPVTTAGQIGGARTLNGTSNYFTTTNTAAGSPLDFAQNGNYSVSAWVNTTAATGNAVLVSKNDNDYAMKLFASGVWEFFEFEAGSGWNSVQAPATADVGVWDHIEGVWSGTNAYLYINGELVSNSPVLTSSTAARNTATTVTIGRQNETANRYFSGLVDEIRMSSVAYDSNWVRLEFQNQQTNQTLVSLSDTIPALAVAPVIAPKSFAVWTSNSSMMFRIPAEATTGQISVMDVWGRVVWSHNVGNGIRELTWNGIGSNGRSAVAGIYLVRLNVLNEHNQSRQVLVNKILFTR